jgi:hypothetical protein
MIPEYALDLTISFSCFCTNEIYWPVLKHGPRSVTLVQVFDVVSSSAQWKYRRRFFFVEMPIHAVCGFSIVRLLLLWEVRNIARPIRPERWWAILAQGEARGNSGGSSQRYWRANRSSDVGIGAKDLSNHLVAGSLRSFPQDSWNVVAVLSGKAND